MSKDEFKKKLGESLREEREVAGLSRSEVAQALCVSDSSVARWERGENSPGVYDLRRLRKLFRKAEVTAE